MALAAATTMAVAGLVGAASAPSAAGAVAPGGATTPAALSGPIGSSSVNAPKQLSALFDNAGISDDANPAAADLDGDGNSFSAEALASVGWAPGQVLTLADGASAQAPNIPPGQADNVLAAGQSVGLTGSGAALDFIVTSTNGPVGGSGTVTYTDGSTQTYTLTAPDWWTGTTNLAAATQYRNNPGGAQAHQVSLFDESVALNSSKTVASVTLPNVGTGTVGVAALHVFALAIAPAGGPTGLSAYFDNVGISDNSDTGAGALDGEGDSFSAEDLAAAGWVPGAVVTANDTTLTWPNVPSGEPDNVVADGQRFSLSGSGDGLSFVLASTNGGTSGTGTITYTDGSTQTYTLTVPDWYVGATDTMSLQMSDWNTPSGTASAPVKLYTDTVPLNPAKNVASVTLPAISAQATGGVVAMHVFAASVRPAAGTWTGTWAAALDDGLVNGPWTNRTLRMVEHTSAGGSAVRIRLDNDFATAPVLIAHATIAVQSSASSATATPVTLTFNGTQEVTIPAGGQAESDGVGFTVPPDTNLLVSLFLPGPVNLAPFHSLGQQDMYSTADQAGDQTADVANYPVNNTFGFWTLLSGIDVESPGSAGTVVAFGDSITDGVGSDVDGNDRWPNDLARRILDQSQYPQYGVLDEGISGNRVVSDDFNGTAGSGTGGIAAVARTDRDVFAQSNVKALIVLEGINDIKSGATAAQVISGLEQIAAAAHAYGIRVIVGTITPFGGYSGYTAAYEAVRENVNSFIRSNGGVFDGVVDFDATVRDPSNPTAMLAAYDSGDHLHPSAAGYQAMANAISLAQL
ncbi:MAG TPA: SGNH/GDSL hydrolase family protein [Actinocrinis sp.]